jgi:hypothetical protein
VAKQNVESKPASITQISGGWAIKDHDNIHIRAWASFSTGLGAKEKDLDQLGAKPGLGGSEVRLQGA